MVSVSQSVELMPYRKAFIDRLSSKPRIKAPKQPTTTPTTAATTPCRIMSFRILAGCAPSAMRMPISRGAGRAAGENSEAHDPARGGCGGGWRGGGLLRRFNSRLAAQAIDECLSVRHQFHRLADADHCLGNAAARGPDCVLCSRAPRD